MSAIENRNNLFHFFAICAEESVTALSSAKNTPKRSEVPVEMTWDLTLVYPSVEEWETDFARLEAQLPAFAAFSGQLDHASTLLECLKMRDETGAQIGKLYSWASLSKAGDNADPEAQARYDRIVGLYSRRAAMTSFIEPQILAVPTETLQSLLDAEDGLKVYDYYFQTLERQRAHTRSAEVEEVLAQMSESLGAAQTAFRQFNNADIKFPPILDENGVEQELTHGKFINFLQSENREVRERAFKTYHNEFSKWRNTLATTLGGTVKSHVALSRVRGYASVLDMELGPDAIPTSVYTNLIATVHERLPVLHRYLRLRKKRLGLDTLKMWDLYVPIVANVERKIAFGEGKKLVLESIKPLGAEPSKIIARGFEERWVDVLENEGKTSGAFSDGSFLTPPYMLLNYQEKLESVFTLAHEWGHSLHSYLARETQPYVYSGYTIFVAEVASTLLEALLSHYMLEDARQKGDRELQMYLLNQVAERFRQTLFRQTLFAEFELKIHEAVERNEPLTAQGMSEIYLQINRDYYGAEVEVDEIAAIEWARIPHFYYGYYVYQYATGISAAQGLARQILAEGDVAVERYLNFLRGGGSKTSIDLLKGAGVDMTTPAPIHAALDAFEDAVAQMEELA
ncbi:oligoendopeptidase F, plasmid [Abditibacteriota bacterium]|nr:oligoendopeptidase F, plasmid [Abditibacteriota bacterium]